MSVEARAEDFVSLRLVVPDAAVELELDRPEMVLGRHSHSDVRLPLPEVSRQHCRFAFQEGEWHVWDMKSLNGIYINGSRVDHSVLRSRDQVGIGSMTFEVRMPGDGPCESRMLSSIVRQLSECSESRLVS